MVKFHRMSHTQVKDKLDSFRSKLSKLNCDDSSIVKFDKNIQDVKADYEQYIKDAPDDIVQAELMKKKRINVYKKKKFEEIKKKLETLFKHIEDIKIIREELKRRNDNKSKRTRKEEEERKTVIDRICREKITLREKLAKLEDILDENELKTLMYGIEEVEEAEEFMISDHPKKIDFGITNRWRARFYRRPKDLIFLRLSLCMKIVHTVWKCGDFDASVLLFRNGKMSDEDGEGIFNYKKGTLTYKGVLYNLLPESPDLIDRAFQTHEGLFDKWKDFDNLFNINGVKCVPDKDKCTSSEPRICMSHRDIFHDMDYHFVRPDYYFPTYRFLHTGYKGKFLS